MAVTPIELLPNDGSVEPISHGTGFFWRAGSRVFLITARHVVSGLYPFDDSLVSKMGYLPERIRIFPSRYEQQVGAAPTARLVGIELNVREDGRPMWLEDPRFQELRTDIAALELPIGETERLVCLNDNPNTFPDMFSHVGFECVVVGYPTRHFGGLMTPIWRRGTIASEPALPVDGKPMFLLDASTSPGFSGGPVFRRHIGPLPTHGPDGGIIIQPTTVVTTSFVGVYAGRLEHSHFGGEVPFVFYGNRIPEILA